MEKEGWLTQRKQAQAFWAQARADFATAVTLIDAGVYYASVFFSQQAAEKALKAVAISAHHRHPKGHHLIQIANSMNAPIEVMNAAAELNVEFLAARNPEVVDGVPAQMYDCDSARIHLQAASDILDWAKREM